MGEEDLGVRASDEVKMQDAFGSMASKMGGIAGTLHITSPSDIQTIPNVAWDLAVKSGKAVIVVVRPPKKL